MLIRVMLYLKFDHSEKCWYRYLIVLCYTGYCKFEMLHLKYGNLCKKYVFLKIMNDVKEIS